MALYGVPVYFIITVSEILTLFFIYTFLLGHRTLSGARIASGCCTILAIVSIGTIVYSDGFVRDERDSATMLLATFAILIGCIMPFLEWAWQVQHPSDDPEE